MTILNILLGVVAVFLLMGVIAEEDRNKNNNLTISFVAVLVFIISLNIIA